MLYRDLGELFVISGEITEEQLNRAREVQNKNGKMIGQVLSELGYVSQRSVYEMLARQSGVQFVDITNFVIPKEMSRILPRSIARKFTLVPLSEANGTIRIAMTDPRNFVAIDEVKLATKRKVEIVLSTEESIVRAVTDLYASETAEKALQDLKSDTAEEDTFNRMVEDIAGADSENAAPTIRLVNSFIEYAVNQNASDIHLEPREDHMAVRMRVDGMLRQVFTVPHKTQNAVIARIKVMGNMDISEHRIPLDGRSNARVGDKNIDLRISTLPTVFGEKVAIRLLYKSATLMNTGGIGLKGKNLEKFENLLKNSNGVILIVGPTGSGKSTSMYTMIKQLNTEQVNLVTLEDPVEYNFPGVNQVQINEKVGMTFANGLRSILRQDPDIIAVGEIRDGETADIAMRAAITGHLVLSTLHTNDAPSTISRLLDMGVKGFLIATALKGVISQRLVRRICPNCRQDYSASKEEQAMIGLPYVPGRKFYRGKGCPLCFNTGYRGRTAVFEILTINKAMERAIADDAPQAEFLQLVSESDFVPLINDCAKLVLDGTTTVDEAFKTVNSTAV